MREIKFRAWTGAKMFNVDVLAISKVMWDSGGTGVSLASQRSIKVMQYTGLKDKVGMEIYEGDIVKAYSQGLCGIFTVKWRQIGSPSWILYPAWQFDKSWNLHGTLFPDGSYCDDVEVIGNIYENPELLNKM